jgi:hypothetical protein
MRRIAGKVNGGDKKDIFLLICVADAVTYPKLPLEVSRMSGITSNGLMPSKLKI